jgi:hypothetical protein
MIVIRRLLFASFVVLLALQHRNVFAQRPPRNRAAVFAHGDLRVSGNRRYWVHADGTPFFYLGDTAWELFHRLTREEAARYLEDRREKGFTVIQAVALAEFDGLATPNAYGHTPLINNDPTKPSEDYFKHIDWIIGLAEAKGLYIGLLPTWGDKVGPLLWGKGPVVFNATNARTYGRFLGARYKDRPNIIWILGGDRPADDTRDVWRAMAAGLKEGDGGRHLMTYHPVGGKSSAEWFHTDEWLASNMLQSGHSRVDAANYAMIAKDYERAPAKPCLDGEPRYEDHPIDWKPEKGWFNDYDVRQAAYWALFAGAHGHTYGCHDIWQFYAEGRTPISAARTLWTEALNLAGARQVGYIRRLIESRPFLMRVPDQSLIAAEQGTGADHAQATRGADGSYAFIYLPTGKAIEIDLDKLSGKRIRAWWFDPRSGTATSAGTFARKGTRPMTPPSTGRGNDWVLVLDDAAKPYPGPGARAFLGAKDKTV